jgi:hypothetical protein
MNSGLKIFGWRPSASLSGSPASTSLRTAISTSLSFSFSICSSSTNRERRIVMPEETIVASWREKIDSSVSVTRWNRLMLSAETLRFSAISRTISPRDLSWSDTACLVSASSVPRS